LAASFWGVLDNVALSSLSPGVKALLIPIADVLINNTSTLADRATTMGYSTDATELETAVASFEDILSGLNTPASWRSLEDATDLGDVAQEFAIAFSQCTQLYFALESKLAVAASLVLGVETEEESGASYTFVSDDRGKTKRLTHASLITATLPNSLPAGWYCAVVQGGAGRVKLDPAAGATLNDGKAIQYNATYEMDSALSLWIDNNTDDVSAYYLAAGDMVVEA
jgi:hypothetical protein